MAQLCDELLQVRGEKRLILGNQDAQGSCDSVHIRKTGRSGPGELAHGLACAKKRSVKRDRESH